MNLFGGCGLIADGSYWAWGSGSQGRLGNQTTTNVSSPISVVGNHIFIQLSGGAVESTATNPYQMGLKSDGSVWTWGYNSQGQLGNQSITAVSSPVSVVGAHVFTSISASSDEASYALKSDGSAWSWGNGAAGALGNFTVTSVSSPVSVVGAHSFVIITSGGNRNSTDQAFAIGLKITGDAWAWGSGTNGATGINTTANRSSPISVVGAHSFIAVTATGWSNGGGLKADGSVWTWGDNTFGQIGNQSGTAAFSSPVSVVGGHSFISVKGGARHFIGLKSDGSCWAWGDDTSGQLGNQTTTAVSSPVSVVGAHSFVAIQGGEQFSFALKANGSIWSWGLNTSGQLGDLTLTSKSSPVSVVGGFNFLSIPEYSNANKTISVSALSLTSSLKTPSVNISKIISPVALSLTATLKTPVVTTGIIVSVSPLSLTASLKSPSLLISSTIHPSALSLTATLKTPTVTEVDVVNSASAILSFNPLVIVSNTSPIQVTVVNVTSPDSPSWITYTIMGADYAKTVSYNSTLGKVYVGCANGIIVEFNSSDFTSYSIINTGATGNLTSMDVLPDFFELYGGTDYSLGEAINMYEGTAITVSTDIRFSSLVQTILALNINTINGTSINTDIRWNQIINNLVGCDVRFISSSFADLSITPIARPDFHIYVNNVELTDVKLDSITIRHTADEKSQATFTLARKHDNVNYMLDGTYSPLSNNLPIKITIQDHQEFGYDTPAYIWEIDCHSDTESVKITAFSQLPKQDVRNTVGLSIPGINEKLHVYHALINNPDINNANLLPDDISPPFYTGIQIDPGIKRIQNVSRWESFQDGAALAEQITNPSQFQIDFPDNPLFVPFQNWTYFWFASATNFVTGENWSSLNYIGTSLNSLTSKTWNVDSLEYWYQRQFPDTLYGLGLATVYPSDFLGNVPFGQNLTLADQYLGISDPFNGATTIDQVLRDHSSKTYTGAQVLIMKQNLANRANNYGINATGGELVTLDLSTKILDVISSKLGIFWGSAPYKKVSCTSGILIPAQKWEDKPDGLYLHTDKGYNYTDYINLVGSLEFKKIQNINGSVLPKTKTEVELFIDGYYYYNIALLKRLNIDNTTQANIYNGQNGFPVSVKTIEINSNTMKVTLSSDNQWSRLELLEIEGQMPDPNLYIIPEQLQLQFNKFDPNTLQDIQ